MERCAPVLLKEAREEADARLVESSLRGDPGAFDELVRRYKDRVYGVIYRFVGNHEDAMDLAQEVFVRAYQGLHAYRGHSQVYTWLYSIAANLSRNRLRDRTRKGRSRATSLEALEEAGAGMAAPGAGPREAAAKRELEAALEDCLADLPELYRFAFCLKTFDGMGYEEIALTVGCPPGTVKSRLNEARKRLHACLHGKGVV